MNATLYDNDFMLYLKQIYNLGYHKYREDKSIYFSNPSGNRFDGYLYPDGYGYASGFDKETFYFISGEFTCLGDQGYYYNYTFKENEKYQELGGEQWNYTCADEDLSQYLEQTSDEVDDYSLLM